MISLMPPLVTSRLLQLRLQLGQLHPLRRVGWRQQAGRVQRQALVGHQVGLARQAVLQLQALQLLGQDGLAAAQVSVGSSAQSRAWFWSWLLSWLLSWLWSWLWSRLWLWLGVQGGAGGRGVLQVRGGGGRLGSEELGVQPSADVWTSCSPSCRRQLVTWWRPARVSWRGGRPTNSCRRRS